MIDECMKVFKKNPPDIVHDIHDVGDYIVVNKDDTVNFVSFKKGTRLNKNDKLYKNICFYDYHSSLINMNKAQDNKKIIHSNNYMSFWVKYENIDSGKLTAKIIDNYFNKLLNPGENCKKAEQTLYELAHKVAGDINTVRLEKNKKWIKDHIFCLEKLGVNLQKKNYLKIFFEDDEEVYINEENRYLIPNIFLKNDFNIKMNDNIYGLPNDNMVLNLKKPYLEHRTRKLSIPTLIDIEQALGQRELFKFFLKNATHGKNLIFFDTWKDNIISCQNGELPQCNISGYMLFVQNNLSAIIKYSNLVNYNYKLKKPFELKKYLQDDKNEQYYSVYNNKQEFLDIIDNVFFNKYLKYNMFNEIDTLHIDMNIKCNLIMYRNNIIDWIFNNSGNINEILHKIGIGCIYQQIDNGFISRALLALNLVQSLDLYFNDSITNQADDKYWIDIGKLIRFYSSICKGHERDSINKMLKISKLSVMLKQLDRIFLKYNYKVKSDKILQLYSDIKEYNCKSKHTNELGILIGYFL